MRTSAGLIVFRQRKRGIEVLLVHPGGPFWQHRDDGAWSIPKGELTAGESHLAAALREYREELGADPPATDAIALGEVRQRNGKRVIAFAAEGDFDTATLMSNSFEIEWPPHSGRLVEFPEVDRAEWFPLATARTKLLAAQAPLLDRLSAALRSL